MAVIAAELFGFRLVRVIFRRAEATIGVAAGDELFGIFLVDRLALALHIGTESAALFGAFIGDDVRGGKALVDDLACAFDEAFLIRVLDAQDEVAALGLREEIAVKRRAQIADVHVARGTGREARAYTIAQDDSSRCSFCIYSSFLL